MRADAIALEETRLDSIRHLDDYEMLHERHRAFPAVFEHRGHRRIIDVSAGVGVVGTRIKEQYPCELVCNDISPACLRLLHENGLETTTFDLDTEDGQFPFPAGSFDAIVCLATIEHIINVEHFLAELQRILAENGRLYLSAPNYSGLGYLLPFLFTGRTFHDPLNEADRYEFFAHVRYFTYRTLMEYVSSRGFACETVYVPLPAESTKYQSMKRRAPVRAWAVRLVLRLIYTAGSPRWCSEPILCFRKSSSPVSRPRIVIL